MYDSDYLEGVVSDVKDMPLISQYEEVGILGLTHATSGGAGNNNTGTDYVGVWEGLVNAGVLTDDQFGLYLKRDPVSSTEQTTSGGVVHGAGGTLTLGGVDTSVINGQLNYVDLPIQDSEFWAVTLDSLSMDGVAVDGSEGQAAIDSGTTMIFGPASVVDTIFQNVSGAYNDPDNGWMMPCVSAIPEVSLTFGGVVYPIFAGDLLRQSVGNDSMCSAMIGSGFSSNNFNWIVGATFLKNVYTAFRAKPTAQVGFASLTDAANVRSPSAVGPPVQPTTGA